MPIKRIWWIACLLIGSVTGLNAAHVKPVTTGPKVVDYTIKAGDTLRVSLSDTTALSRKSRKSMGSLYRACCGLDRK